MKMNAIRQRLLFVILLLSCCGGGLMAQTFYEVQYTDKQGYDNYGLMLYTDEEDCTLYLRRHTTEGKDFSFRELDYVSERNDEEKDEEVEYQIMVCEEDNTPIFIWIWDKEESEEQQLIPYVTLDEDDDPEDWIRANSFVEVDLRELTPGYLKQYLDPKAGLYRQITKARKEVLAADKAANAERQSAIANLGDGTGIFNTIYAAAMEARKPEAEKQNPSTGNKQNGQTSGNVQKCCCRSQLQCP